MTQQAFGFAEPPAHCRPRREPHPEAIARDEATAQVLENAGEDWRIAAREIVRRMEAPEVTGEEIRLACEAAGVRPHHHNAWGGFILMLVRSGQLADTGRRVPMRAPGSHARKTTVYRRMA